MQFSDVTGAVKTVAVPARRLAHVLASGEWFDGSAVEGLAREVESDMYLRPDPSTFAILEPAAGVPCARLICEVVTPSGEPYRGDGRGTLRSLLDGAESSGLGYLVAPEARGRGVAVRALRLVTHWGFEQLRIERLALWTLPGNVRSQRVAERAGFRFEGLARNWESDRDEQAMDAVMYSLTPEDLAVMQGYMARLQAANSIDFSGLLSEAVRVFSCSGQKSRRPNIASSDGVSVSARKAENTIAETIDSENCR